MASTTSSSSNNSTTKITATSLLPGEKTILNIQNVALIVYNPSDSQQQTTTPHPQNLILGNFIITNFQCFLLELDSQWRPNSVFHAAVPFGLIRKTKKYKNQALPFAITDPSLFFEIQTKDFRRLMFLLPSSPCISSKALRRMLSSLSIPAHYESLFAFCFAPTLSTLNGWEIYDPMKEYQRIGLLDEDSGLRITNTNKDYVICTTYPEFFIVPKDVSDETVIKVSQFRSKGRLPACVWKNRSNGATIFRCSQPLVGLSSSRSEDDENYFKEIMKANKTNPKVLYIIDCRPKVNASANSLSGGGTEAVANYAGCILEYLNIGNIHVMRDCLKKLYKVCVSWHDEKIGWQEVRETHWLDHIAKILAGTFRIIQIIQEGASVLIHCSDGWDRTSQMSALAQLLMDPYYRTIEGFIVLITKEFLSFGHKFCTRQGHLSKGPESQRAPIFLQFLDCVWQLTRQFPMSFEFNEKFLVFVVDHSSSGIFGTFFYDSEYEREKNQLKHTSQSLWGLILNKSEITTHFTNKLYQPFDNTVNSNIVKINVHNNVNNNNPRMNKTSGSGFFSDGLGEVLMPNPSLAGIQLWRGYYLRWREGDSIQMFKLPTINSPQQNYFCSMQLLGDLLSQWEGRKSNRESIPFLFLPNTTASDLPIFKGESSSSWVRGDVNGSHSSDDTHSDIDERDNDIEHDEEDEEMNETPDNNSTRSEPKTKSTLFRLSNNTIASKIKSKFFQAPPPSESPEENSNNNNNNNDNNINNRFLTKLTLLTGFSKKEKPSTETP